MSKKLTDDEIARIKVQVMIPEFYKKIDDYLEDDDLIGKLRYTFSATCSLKEREYIEDEVFTDFAKQFDNSIDLEQIVMKMMDVRLKNALAKVIVRHQDELDASFALEQIANIAFAVEDTDFLQECLDHADEYNIDEFGKQLIESELFFYSGEFFEDEPSAEEIIALDRLIEEENLFSEDIGSDEKEEKRKYVWEQAGGYFDTRQGPVKTFEKDKSLGPLDYTEAEKYAIKIYEGVAPGKSILSSDVQGYRILNTLLYPGIDNEMERIFDDNVKLNASAIYFADELMDRSVDLYSAMYKYGQRMPHQKVGYRVDRLSAADMIAREGRTISNFSTSTTGYKRFAKANIALERAIIEKGTPCADFNEILGPKDYEMDHESEILVAPMCPVEVLDERLPSTPAEMKMTNTEYKPAAKVYEFKISPQPKAKPFTQEELADYEKYEEIFNDENYRQKAAEFISKVYYLKFDGFTKEETMYIMDKTDLDMYVTWKEAYQEVYKHRIRERELKIDKQVKKAEKSGKPLFTLTPEEERKKRIAEWEKESLREADVEDFHNVDISGIPLMDIERLAKSRDLNQNTKVIQNIQKFMERIVGKSQESDRER